MNNELEWFIFLGYLSSVPRLTDRLTYRSRIRTCERNTVLDLHQKCFYIMIRMNFYYSSKPSYLTRKNHNASLLLTEVPLQTYPKWLLWYDPNTSKEMRAGLRKIILLEKYVDCRTYYQRNENVYHLLINTYLRVTYFFYFISLKNDSLAKLQQKEITLILYEAAFSLRIFHKSLVRCLLIKLLLKLKGADEILFRSS